MSQDDLYGASNRSCCYCNFGGDSKYNLIMHLVLAHPEEIRSGDIDNHSMPKWAVALAKTTRQMYDEIGDPPFGAISTP